MTPIAKMAPAINSGEWMQDLSFEEFEVVVGMKVHTAAGVCFSHAAATCGCVCKLCGLWPRFFWGSCAEAVHPVPAGGGHRITKEHRTTGSLSTLRTAKFL